MLPTLVFILWAYGMYAIISALIRRKGSKFRARSAGKRCGWFALAMGSLIGLGLAVLLVQSFDEQDHQLKLTGFLGTVWAEGWPDKVGQRVEYPPIKETASGGQPAYALLHPGASPVELAQEKTAPRPRPIKKQKVRKVAASQAKGPKPSVHAAKKDKAAAKGKPKATTAKKKKPMRSEPTAAKKSSETVG
ncbi:MAG: hypothetical protein M1438_07555 [Deltaproteobacteria bacterium]|nr:hypothetical protein [Deltaproteobacteria bacterium]